MERAELTPTQRAALVAWHLGQGDGLTIGQVKRLGQYGETRKARFLISAVANVIPLGCDGETWAAAFTPCDDGTPQTARERAAITAYLLATKGAVTNQELRQRLGISRQKVTAMLDKLSVILPLYYEAGEWRILTMRELEN